jgi:hypothetical protein
MGRLKILNVFYYFISQMSLIFIKMVFNLSFKPLYLLWKVKLQIFQKFVNSSADCMLCYCYIHLDFLMKAFLRENLVQLVKKFFFLIFFQFWLFVTNCFHSTFYRLFLLSWFNTSINQYFFIAFCLYFMQSINLSLLAILNIFL